MNEQELSERSPHFQQFYRELFGDAYMAWHDGIERGLQSLQELNGKERALAEDLLIDALDACR